MKKYIIYYRKSREKKIIIKLKIKNYNDIFL